MNEIHPAREMDCNGSKKWYLTNLSRPRFHGLIAYIDGKKGYYCLTRKAGKFLRGEAIPQYAIISKATGHQEGYWMPETYKITRRDVLKDDDVAYWEGDQQRMIDIIDPIEHSGQLSLFGTRPKIHLVLRQEMVKV